MAPINEVGKGEKHEISEMIDLDSANTSRAEFNRTPSVNFAIICRPATAVGLTTQENDDLNATETAKIAIRHQEKRNKDVVEGSALDDFYLPVKDIECLCGGSSSSNDNEHEPVSTLTSLDTGLSTKCQIKTWKSSGKGKKRKKIKGQPKRKITKRQKTDVCMTSVSSSIENNLENTKFNLSVENTKGQFTFNAGNIVRKTCKKTVGDGKHTTTPKGGCVATQSDHTAKSKACTSNFPAHNGRRGGGDDDDDGDDEKPPKKPPDDVQHRSHVVPKQRKKKTSEMEVDSADESANAPLERPTSRSSNDQEMVTISEHCNNNQPKPPVPVQQTQQQQQQQQQAVRPTEQFLTWLHGSINHYHYNYKKCKKGADCFQCKRVEKMFSEHFYEMNGCCNCNMCQLASCVKNFHARLCHIENCVVCSRPKAVPKQQQPVAARRVVQQQEQEHLNVPVSGESLDPDDLIVWKDQCIPEGVRHFKEDVHYMVKSDVLDKGGHGSVHDLIVQDDIKIKYFNSDRFDLVMKQAPKVEEDEKYVLTNMSKHPNFVKTFLVLQKNGHQRIIMEKCEKSLKMYLKELVESNERLKMHEAMFYWTQTLDAVKHLHNLKIPAIHKDIKAENVLLSVMDNLVRVKLADFDTVKRLHHEFTPHGLPVKGTPGLIAPEVLRQTSHGRPADIWNMAMFLMQLLFPVDFTMKLQCRIKNLRMKKGTNVYTFIHDTERAIEDFLNEKIPELKKIDSEVAEVILACLNENPEDRPTASNVLKHPAVAKYMNKKIDMDKLIQKICPNKFSC